MLLKLAIYVYDMNTQASDSIKCVFDLQVYTLQV